jgi:hypothetical protein
MTLRRKVLSNAALAVSTRLKIACAGIAIIFGAKRAVQLRRHTTHRKRLKPDLMIRPHRMLDRSAFAPGDSGLTDTHFHIPKRQFRNRPAPIEVSKTQTNNRRDRRCH